MAREVRQIVPERLFSFTWHPYGVDPNVDYPKETPTLVESGFDQVPGHRRAEAWRMNDGGRTQQVATIARHVG